ncbi:hypothetical protein HDU85_003228 [Gaertneriomyces sp. JEL0708]|nr:hypothetical protein HDU85_003228 [Gaertneriomyces sp. JEL0708]
MAGIVAAESIGERRRDSHSPALRPICFARRRHTVAVPSAEWSNATIQSDDHTKNVVLQWDDANTSRFKYVWLRDNCQCPQCVHPSNRQKLHSSADVNPDVRPKSIRHLKDNAALEVQWEKGSMLPGHLAGEHKTILSLPWLRDNEYSPEAVQRRRDRHFEPVFWEGEQYNVRRRNVHFKEFMETDTGLVVALEELRDYGLCFIRGAPTEDKMVESLARRFGSLRETFYGPSWDVKNVQQAKNIAYTSLDLGLHMDLMYFEAPPGLQLLHCLKNSVTGGESIFVDSFKAVEILKEKYPEDYEVLTKVPVTFHYINDDRHMHFRRPTIVENDLNEHRMVYYAPPFQGPIEAPEEMVEPFYTAFRRFADILKDPKLVYTTLLQPGDCVVFANRRVLHGRKEFDATSGDRHLKGAYVDWDDFKDRLRIYTPGK